MPENTEYYSEIRPQSSVGMSFRELRDYKELFYFFTWRDVKLRYKQTVLGFLWAVLQPLLLMLIFTHTLARALNIPSDEIKYQVFVYSGLLLWLIFSTGLTAAGTSMIANAVIIKKIYFPRIVIPVSAIMVAVFDFVMGFIVFIGLLIYYQQPVDFTEMILLWPASLALTIVGTLGPGCWLAALNIKYRDFRFVVPFLVQMLLFLTPVIYPLSVLDNASLKYLLAVNPMYAPITMFRMPMTTMSVDPVLISISIVSGFVLLIIGLSYFTRTERFFADLA